MGMVARLYRLNRQCVYRDYFGKNGERCGDLAGDHARFVDEERIACDACYADNVHHNHVLFWGFFSPPLRPLQS